jgi:hypothetical protein
MRCITFGSQIDRLEEVLVEGADRCRLTPVSRILDNPSGAIQRGREILRPYHVVHTQRFF